MVALQIRDVPDDVCQTLADRAAAAGQSLQAFLLLLVTDEARRAGNAALLQRFDSRSDGSYLDDDQAMQLLDDERVSCAATSVGTTRPTSRSPSTSPARW